jgi:gentisate 1,2-dioxygenase
MRSFLLEAGSLISAEDAERRVLVLENPARPGQAAITPLHYAGLQLILPGESAPGHRHTQSALRFILEGSGAFTAVDGEKAYMERGDLLLTPNWRWHEHGNEGDGPMIWLDGLDIPLVRILGASFAEKWRGAPLRSNKQPGDSEARFAAGLAPLAPDLDVASPVIRYPYARTRPALLALQNSSDVDPAHGLRMRYVNPATGGDVLPTISTELRLLHDRFAGVPVRCTESTVFVVVEGAGTTIADGRTLSWAANDVFVVPGWTWHEHRAEEQSILFSYSDRGLQQALGLWREDRRPT